MSKVRICADCTHIADRCDGDTHEYLCGACEADRNQNRELRAKLEELEMHNTEHHCGVGEITKERDKLRCENEIMREALELIRDGHTSCMLRSEKHRCRGVVKEALAKIQDEDKSDE